MEQRPEQVCGGGCMSEKYNITIEGLGANFVKHIKLETGKLIMYHSDGSTNEFILNFTNLEADMLVFKKKQPECSICSEGGNNTENCPECKNTGLEVTE